MIEKRVWKYRLADIAEACGITLRRVKYLRKLGRFSPDDFAGVCEFVAECRRVKG
jgi:hypothetical protein